MADLLNLLHEISSDNSCGEYLEYDPAYLEFAKNILGKPEDLITGEKAQPPNWREIQKNGLALLQRTKDLQIVIYLLRALIHLEGVSGFRDGLNLLQALLEKYWDNIHPVLDPDDNFDPTTRVNIVEELNNYDSVIGPINLSTLVDSKAVGRFCLRDIHIATEQIDLPKGATKTDLGIIKAAFQNLPTEPGRATYRAIKDSAGIVQHLETFFNEKVGIGNGPNFSALTVVLKDMRNVFEQFAATDVLNENVQAPDVDLTLEQTEQMAKSSGRHAGVGAIQSRQDVLKALDLIVKYYAEKEPSSPVPILLQRAKILVTSDFMQIVENLLPDAVSQLKLIKGPDSDTN